MRPGSNKNIQIPAISPFRSSPLANHHLFLLWSPAQCSTGSGSVSSLLLLLLLLELIIFEISIAEERRSKNISYISHCGYRSNKCFHRRWQGQVNLLLRGNWYLPTRAEGNTPPRGGSSTSGGRVGGASLSRPSTLLCNISLLSGL